MLKALASFAREEITLTVSFIVTIISCFIVHPDSGYLSYIDYNVLILLFVLMCVSSGLRRSGFFAYTALRLTGSSSSLRRVSLLLMLVTFFSSMLVTNDVALIMFVPLTLSMLRGQCSGRDMALLVVFETIAANLGSMVTPFGNPQNLFIYSYYMLSAGEFFSLILPYSALSLLLLAGSLLVFTGKGSIRAENEETAIDRRLLTLHLILFFIAILSVFRILDKRILLVIALVLLAAGDRKAFREADYCLLLTFICFFIFSGNLGRIESVRKLLEAITGEHALEAGLIASQVISNVPAAVLLSPFTQDWQGILLGTDIGGLGTPIASLASLISLKFIFKEEGVSRKGYLISFEAFNAAFLVILAAVAAIFS